MFVGTTCLNADSINLCFCALLFYRQCSHMDTVWRVPKVAKCPPGLLRQHSWCLALQPKPQSSLQVCLTSSHWGGAHINRAGAWLHLSHTSWHDTRIALCHHKVWFTCDFTNFVAAVVIKRLQRGMVTLAIDHARVALPCLCSCMSSCTVPKSTSSSCAGAKRVHCAWGQYRELTPVKQTGLLGSNVLVHATDCQVWVWPYSLRQQACFGGQCLYGSTQFRLLL